MHSIRLRHPWQSESDGGTIVWTRKFNWPADLVSGEVVQLVVEQTPSSAAITLNGKPLTATATGRFDITSSLAKHNRLAIAAPSADFERCPFEVRLEIGESC